MRSVVAGLISLFVPGFGAALVGRMRAMIAWALVCAAAVAAAQLSVWFIAIAFALRIAAGIDGFRVVRAANVRSDGLGGLIAVGVNLAFLVPLRLFALEAFKVPSSAMVPTLQVGDHLMANKLSLLWRPPARGDVIIFRQPCEPDRDYIKRVIGLAGDSVEIRCNVVYVGGKPLASKLAQGEACRYDDFDEYATSWHDRPCSEYVETSDGNSYHVLHDADRPRRDARAPGELPSDSKDFPRLDGPHTPPSCMSQIDGAQRSGQEPGTIVETKPGAGACEPQLHYVVPPGHVFVLGDNRPNSNDSRYWGSVPVANVRGRAFGIWFSDGRSGPSFRRVGSID